MSKTAANPNDPFVILTRARASLKRVELAQRRSFENWGTSWKAKRALALTLINDETFKQLVALGECNAHDSKVRDEALKNRALDEHGGEDAVATDDDMVPNE